MFGLFAMVMWLAAPAGAHDPIFIADDQTTPDVGPFMPDGTISWALYGQVLGDGDTRGFEFDLRDGDEFFIGLLIPNLAPEVDLADPDLPILRVIDPDGTERSFAAEMRDVFDEPFSGTSYVNLFELREPSRGGRYQVIVEGKAPSRFSVAVGESEIFFTEAERAGDRPESFLEITEPLQAWYSTPPGGESTGPVDGVGIRTDLIEESMESGEAQLGEGVDEDQAMADDVVDDSTSEPVASETAAPEPDAPEPDPASSEPAESESAESEPAESEPIESSSDDAEVSDEPVAEVAAEASSDGSDGSAAWVAPVVIALIAVAGAAWFVLQRRGAAS
ncbi:MAG: hypothetical protein AAF567_20690 [Actinomycetota bacterium]